MALTQLERFRREIVRTEYIALRPEGDLTEKWVAKFLTGDVGWMMITEGELFRAVADVYPRDAIQIGGMAIRRLGSMNEGMRLVGGSDSQAVTEEKKLIEVRVRDIKASLQ